MPASTPVLLLALAGLSLGNPVTPPSSKVCAAISAVVSEVKALSTATAFCSSLLGIQTVTSTIHTTAVSIASVPSTITTITITPPAVTIVGTSTASVTSCQANAKRSAKTSSTTPSPLKSIAASLLSGACSCLNLPTPTAFTTVVLPSSTTNTYPVTASTTIPASTVTITPTITTCPPAPTPTPTDCSQGGNFTTTDAQGQEYSVACGYIIDSGDDLAEGTPSECQANLEGCMTLCDYTPGCVYFTFAPFDACAVDGGLSKCVQYGSAVQPVLSGGEGNGYAVGSLVS